MKFFPVAVAAVCFLGACHSGPKEPDLSKVPALMVHFERFEKDFFRIDTNQLAQGLQALSARYPYFAGDFVDHILGAGPLSDTNHLAPLACREFLKTYRAVDDSLTQSIGDLQAIESDLAMGLRRVKFYFPQYRLPTRYLTYVGPFDGPGVALTSECLAIGLQAYGGSTLSFYNSPQGQDLFPTYISRRFEPAYIVPNCIKAIEEDLFPDRSGNRTLIEQMIEKGKYWWLLDRLLPATADSLKTGFTARQLSWCSSNEGALWNFIQQNDLYTLDPELIKNYIGESPHTQGMPDASPGNIGQWVGRQIVLQYLEKNPDLSIEQLMKTDARTLFDGSKYKPR